jgi:hypothetical protein
VEDVEVQLVPVHPLPPVLPPPPPGAVTLPALADDGERKGMDVNGVRTTKTEEKKTAMTAMTASWRTRREVVVEFIVPTVSGLCGHASQG